MRNPKSTTLTLTTVSPARLDFKLRLSKRYTLVGSYVDGVLHHISLQKRRESTSKEQ